VTNNTYLLNIAPLNFIDAEESCRQSGGHLTSYHSEEEQADVERYFVNTGGGPSYGRRQRHPSCRQALGSEALAEAALAHLLRSFPAGAPAAQLQHAGPTLTGGCWASSS
jgi:hypothetical protein